MNNARPTPAPWTIRDDGAPTITIEHIYDDGNVESVCDVTIYNFDDEGERLTGIANAKLITAAHALLASLKETAKAECSLNCPSTWKTGTTPPHSEACKRAQAAIALASN